jgi:hypothetical protein
MHITGPGSVPEKRPGFNAPGWHKKPSVEKDLGYAAFAEESY